MLPKNMLLKKALTLRNILVFFGSAVIDFSILNTACSPISSCCWSLQGFWVFLVWLEQDGCPGRLGFCIQKKMLVIHIMIVCNCPVTILSVTEWIRSFLTAYFFSLMTELRVASSLVLVTKVNRQSSVSNTERSVSRKHVMMVWDSLSRQLWKVCVHFMKQLQGEVRMAFWSWIRNRTGGNFPMVLCWLSPFNCCNFTRWLHLGQHHWFVLPENF